MRISLPLSQYFEQVKTDLWPFISAVVVREEKNLNRKFRNKDILVHANGFINDEFDELINNRRFLEKLNSCASLLSFDLGPSCHKIDYSEHGYIAKGPVLTESQILRIADRKISNIRKFFKGIISVENLDYHALGAYEVVCNPDFINKFVEKFNICLTLDIGHVEVTCSNFSIDPYDYLEKLPLSKVVEIHLARSVGSRDSHMLPTEKQYRLLEFILQRVHARYIVLEYYFKPEGIIQGNRELMQFLKDRGLYEN
ncbi:MAG: DUF692 family protein [Candidatus Omnitrophota bacterium]|nr:MAG: DUF692 family protein [Candidatus Omnitrophota bacterium]